MVRWQLDEVAATLGAEVRQRKPEVHSLQLTHKGIGTRLKVDMAPAQNALRLYSDRNDGGRLQVLGRIDLFEINAIDIQGDAGLVRFSTRHPLPIVLEVRADATFLVTIGERQRGERDQEACTKNDDDGLIRLVGRLARPHYSDRSGKPFITAGLAEHPDGALVPVWHNLKGFGGVATSARELQRGAWVRATGKLIEDRYRTDDEEVTKQAILLVHIEACDQQ